MTRGQVKKFEKESLKIIGSGQGLEITATYFLSEAMLDDLYISYKPYYDDRYP